MAFSKFISFSAVIAALAASTTLAQIPTNCARTYQVVANDTCDGISAAQSVSTFQLAHVNSAVINTACTNLFVGETICLGITGQDCSTTAVVNTGDSCPGIASTAGISVATLLVNNKNVDNGCTNIYPGEVLCVGPDVVPYTN